MSLTPLAGDHDDLGFWRTHHRSGVLVALIGGGLVVLYGLLTWGEPHRGWMVGIGLTTAVVAPALMVRVPIERLVRTPWGAPYLYSLELFGVAAVIVTAWLDGGPTSPLALLLFPLLVHGFGAYPPSGRALTGGSLVLGYLALHAVSGAPPADLVLRTLVLVATAYFGWMSTRNHQAVNRHEAAAKRAMKRLADEDHLTGIANRRATHERLTQVAAASSLDRPTSLLMLDVDRFKAINDGQGHHAGDEVLRALAETLRRVSRAGDHVGRLGGDEFVVVLPRTDTEGAVGVAERIHAEVAAAPNPFAVSVGIATVREPIGADDLLRAADTALYHVKGRGGSCTDAVVLGEASLVS